MGYKLKKSDMQKVLDKLKEKYIVYAPKLFAGTGTFSDTNIVRYDNISNAEEIEFEKKSDYSFKEAILPITQLCFILPKTKLKKRTLKEIKERLSF